MQRPAHKATTRGLGAGSNLNPGGHLELNDIDAVPLSDDGPLIEETSLMRSVRTWHRGLAAVGRIFQGVRQVRGARDPGWFQRRPRPEVQVADEQVVEGQEASGAGDVGPREHRPRTGRDSS